jgi:predicted nuclease with TOPRIM domain
MTQQKQNSKVIEMEPLYEEIRKSINNVIDITSRIDERLKILYEKDDEYKEDFQSIFRDISLILQRLASNDCVVPTIVENLNELKKKVYDLEIKMSNVNVAVKDHENKWSKLLDWTFKIALTALSAFAAWKLGTN